VLLRDALAPNLVQTLENNPAFVHAGPFANIAHGCNSAIATRAGLKLADYVVTEAGFGSDLGGEKFFDIKCRKTGLNPDGAVIVATVRALKMHGGIPVDDLTRENAEAVKKGCENLTRHIQIVQQFGVPAVIGLNRFASDTEAEIDVIREAAREHGVEVAICTHFADGGAGAEDLARKVVELTEGQPSQFKPLYEDELPLWDKVKTIATKLYGAADISADAKVQRRIRELQEGGFGHFPVCIAKTQKSFTTDPKAMGAPSGHTVAIREVRLAAGAEFIVVICGDIMTMPGLPRQPAADHMGVTDDGEIYGLA
jgi:formate--tetrahydrofolate ligase